MATTQSKRGAPLGFCPVCFKDKRDWGFRYHRACSKCFAKQQKQRVADLKKRGQYNNNIELKTGLVVTGFVKKRLKKEAEANIPYSATYKLSQLVLIACSILPLVTLFWGIDIGDSKGWFIGLLAVFSTYPVLMLALMWWVAESKKREPFVDAEIERLATERKDSMDLAKTFYRSAEWKLLREQIMNQHQNVCRMCNRVLDRSEITIDHIMPRSKFPDLPLVANNMQVLCRPCNSSKGARVLSQQKRQV